MNFLFGTRGMIYAGLAVVGLLALAVIARNWSCRHGRTPRPLRIHETQAEVDSVPNGATILVKAGVRGRRTSPVLLADVAAPASGEPLFEASRENLARLAGARIRRQTERRFLAENEGPAQAEDGPSESRGPSEAIVFGESGENLCVAQLCAGLGRNRGTRPEWIAAEKEAQDAHRGLWAEPLGEEGSWWPLVVAAILAGGLIVSFCVVVRWGVAALMRCKANLD